MRLSRCMYFKIVEHNINCCVLVYYILSQQNCPREFSPSLFTCSCCSPFSSSVAVSFSLLLPESYTSSLHFSRNGHTYLEMCSRCLSSNAIIIAFEAHYSCNVSTAIKAANKRTGSTEIDSTRPKKKTACF